MVSPPAFDNGLFPPPLRFRRGETNMVVVLLGVFHSSYQRQAKVYDIITIPKLPN